MSRNKLFNKISKPTILISLGSAIALSIVLIVYQDSSASTALAEGIVTVYKSPTCGCCTKWIDHLKTNGFKVKAINTNDMHSVKEKAGVQHGLGSCHTALVDGYVIEGHVPASDIKRLLEQRPSVIGLTVPGMPMGSPGMEGPRKDNYSVLTFDQSGNTTEFSRH
jgi:hypothetical protein